MMSPIAKAFPVRSGHTAPIKLGGGAMSRDAYEIENHAHEAVGATNSPLRLIATEDDSPNVGDIEVDSSQNWPLLPDGEYEACFIKQEIVSLRMFKGETRLFAHFEILDNGSRIGTKIYGAWRILRSSSSGKQRISVGRNSNLYIMLCRVYNDRIRPDRISFQELRDCVLKIKTRTVKKNFRQLVLPECLWYSVVDDIISIEVGSV